MDKPITVSVNPSYFCNFRCDFCYLTEEQLSDQKKIEDFYKIDEITWSSIDDLGSGIFLFRNVLPTSMNIIERLESVLQDPSNQYKYAEAMVGYGMKIPEYRDCYDFKYKKTDIQHDKSEASIKLQQLWDEVYFRQLQAVKYYLTSTQHRL